MSDQTNRRALLAAGAAGAGSLLLGGCNRIYDSPSLRELLTHSEGLTQRAHRALMGRDTLAREYQAADISRTFRPNGSQDAQSLPPGYLDMMTAGFDAWRLTVHGLVRRPTRFTLADLVAMPARSQITRHDCVEGWSCIGGWTGTPLSQVLRRVGLKPEARFIVFHCADEHPRYFRGRSLYYESIDLIDAFHPQTILAYAMNGAPLPVANGAPLRLRVERQLGYKMAKYVHTVELTESLAALGYGKGSYWADRGYEWYAGI